MDYQEHENLLSSKYFSLSDPMLSFCWSLEEENILYFVVMLSPQVGPDNNDIIVCLLVMILIGGRGQAS